MNDEIYYQEMIKEYKKALQVAVESINELEQQNATLLKALLESMISQEAIREVLLEIVGNIGMEVVKDQQAIAKAEGDV